MYPNAAEEEWKTKHSSEKMIRILELIDPNVNLSVKEEELKEESSGKYNTTCITNTVKIATILNM